MAEGYALVTGASRGIGRATAYELAKAGMNLYITCSNTGDELHKIATDLSEKYGIMCIPFIGDMGNYIHVHAGTISDKHPCNRNVVGGNLFAVWVHAGAVDRGLQPGDVRSDGSLRRNRSCFCACGTGCCRSGR